MNQNNGHVSTTYERRIRLAADAIKQHSEIREEEARRLAEHVLRALDHIPEKVR